VVPEKLITGFTAWRRTIAAFDGIAKEIFCAGPAAKHIRLRGRRSQQIVTRMMQRTIDRRATQPSGGDFSSALRCIAKNVAMRGNPMPVLSKEIC